MNNTKEKAAGAMGGAAGASEKAAAAGEKPAYTCEKAAAAGEKPAYICEKAAAAGDGSAGAKRKIKLAIIFGGQSLEHEVSLWSARSVLAGIDPASFDVVLAGIDKRGGCHIYDGPMHRIGDGSLEAMLRLGGDENRAGGGDGTADSAAGVDAASGGDGTADSAAGGAAAGGGDGGDAQLGAHVRSTDGGLAIQELISGGVDVFFPLMHGRLGEDGAIQGMLEMAGAAYVGCGVFSSAACMDKSMAKILLGAAGIPQARHIVFHAGSLCGGMPGTPGAPGGGAPAPGSAESRALEAALQNVEARLGYPCFVKPSSSGSSVGVSKCASRQELVRALRAAALYDRKILVEEYVEGREFECAVLGNDSPEASVVGEIVPGAEFYDYAAKYIDDSSRTFIPADVPAQVSERMRALAVAAFAAMDCSGLARADFFWRGRDGEVVLNEINTMPGFTRISMYPKLWEASGLPYGELLLRLAELAIERRRQKDGLVTTLC